MITKLNYLVAVLLMAVFVATVIPQTDKSTDQMLKSMVEYRLTKMGLLKNNNIQVTVANKVITLNGEVPTLAAKKRATIEAKKVEEDYTIQNNLKVSYEKISDEKLAQEVRNRIDNYMFYTVFDWVTVDVNNGVVTLNGYVHLPWSSDQIATLVENMDGVQKVVNNLQKVISSDELRYQAARAIYTDWRFYYHALDKDPPIHIIVDGPNIILEGTVDNESDKSWAGALINFNTNALQVQNDLKVVKG